MPYHEDLIKLHELAARSDMTTGYRCVWIGDTPFIVVSGKHGEALYEGQLHFVVEQLEKMIPPTIDEMAAALWKVIHDGGTSNMDAADKILERHKSTKPINDEVSFFD